MRKNPPARWTLPIRVDPVDRVCFRVEVPKDVYHIAAFKGAIFALSKPYSWQNDESHTALRVARVWRRIFEGLIAKDCNEDCAATVAETGNEIMIRLNGCELQSSIDGVNWCTFGNINDCINGTVTQPGGKGPGGYAPGEVVEGCFTLNGREIFLLNVPLDSGDTISFHTLSGAWSDNGGALSTWNCPDGDIFTLGLCGGVPSANSGGVDPSAYHGELMLSIDGIWYRPTQAPVTVPSGISSVQGIIQMNDNDLTDNAGTIGFCMTITKNPLPVNTWEHYFDFTTGQHGWEANNGVYAPGIGYQTADAAIAGGYERSVSAKLQTNMLPGSYTKIEEVFSATFGTFGHGGAAASPEFIEAPIGTTVASKTPIAGDTALAYVGTAIVNPADMLAKVFADKQVAAIDLLGQATLIGVRLGGSGPVDPYLGY